MRLGRRRLLAAPLATCLLAACGGLVPPVRLPGVTRKKQTVAFWFDQPAQLPAFQSFADVFAAARDDLELKTTVVPFTEVFPKLRAAAASDTAPDAVKTSGGSLGSVLANGPDGLAAALDKWDTRIGNTDWYKPIAEAVTRKGRVYAMPATSGAVCLVWNKSLYQAAGLNPDAPPRTMDELKAFAGKIAKPTADLWGHYSPYSPSFTGVLFAFGGRDVSDDGKVLVDQPEGIAALQWYLDLIKSRATPSDFMDPAAVVGDYAAGKVGSITIPPGYLTAVEKAPFPSGSAPHPVARAAVAPVSFSVIVVCARAQNPDGGWEFARTVGLDPRWNIAWTQTYGSLPPRISVREADAWKQHEQAHPLLIPFVDAQKNGRVEYAGPGSFPFWATLGQEIAAAMQGKKSAAQAMHDAATRAQGLIDSARASG